MSGPGANFGVGGILGLPEVTARNVALVRRGRLLRTTFLLDAEVVSFLIDILDGHVISVREGPFVMPSWEFALRAPLGEWESYWSPRPPPSSFDLFAMLKRKVLRIEGELHPFMSNLLYFKILLGSLREVAM